jgi:hypothetical protein
MLVRGAFRVTPTWSHQFWIGGGRGDGSSHSLHKAQRGSILGVKGVNTHDARWRFLQRTGRDHGGGHVALCIITSWALIELGSSTQLCCVGSRYEGGGPHHLQGRHIPRPRDWFRELVVSNIQSRQKSFFLSLYLCLAQWLKWLYMFNINHIAICMCNSLTFWFEHPLPQDLSSVKKSETFQVHFTLEGEA